MISRKEYLKRLCSFSSPSGYENNITSYLKKVIASYDSFDIKEDNIGNLIAFKKGLSDKTIMFVAHCDEIGFAIKYIDDSGYLHFSSIGGVDVAILNGQRVVIKSKERKVEGVIGVKPIHFSHNEKKNNTLCISDLWIDIGVNNKEEAESLVSIGDSITFFPNFNELQNDLIASKSIDNRSGVLALLSVAEIINSELLNDNVYLVFSVQEELGLRGAITAGYGINPEICIAVDVTNATDYPSLDKNKYGEIRVGAGPSIPIGANFCSEVQSKIREIAQGENIQIQIESIPGYSGTDIAQVQIVRCGIKTGLISIPCRYMHTPIEIASMSDIESVIKIIVGCCKCGL